MAPILSGNWAISPKRTRLWRAGEPLRAVVYRMAETGVTRMPVVKSETDRTLVGMVSLQDLLRARTRNMEEERRRERVLRIHFPFRARVESQ